jgi:hypothetical protein
MRWLALVFALLLPRPGLAQATLLDSVLAAHGVTAATQSLRLTFEGRYETSGGSSVPFVLKTRGYAESRLELRGSGRTRTFVQSGGFRWSRTGLDAARDHDGRVSLNLPFMDSPSTGLLPFLLARRLDLETIKRTDGTLEGRPAIFVRIRVRDTDSRRLRIGAALDRTFDLLIDPDTYRLAAAAVLRNASRAVESESYEYGGYVKIDDLLFPSTVTRRSKFHPDSLPLRPLSLLRIDRVSVDSTITDDDFRRP